MIEAVKLIPSLEYEILQKDTFIFEQGIKIYELEKKVESIDRESEICSQTVEIQNGQIESISNENFVLDNKLNESEKKLFFQKRLKWFFAGGGVLAGFIGAVFVL